MILFLSNTKYKHRKLISQSREIVKRHFLFSYINQNIPPTQNYCMISQSNLKSNYFFNGSPFNNKVAVGNHTIWLPMTTSLLIGQFSNNRSSYWPIIGLEILLWCLIGRTQIYIYAPCTCARSLT